MERGEGVTGLIFKGLLAALHGGTVGVGIWESFVVPANKFIRFRHLHND